MTSYAMFEAKSMAERLGRVDLDELIFPGQREIKSLTASILQLPDYEFMPGIHEWRLCESAGNTLLTLSTPKMGGEKKYTIEENGRIAEVFWVRPEKLPWVFHDEMYFTVLDHGGEQICEILYYPNNALAFSRKAKEPSQFRVRYQGQEFTFLKDEVSAGWFSCFWYGRLYDSAHAPLLEITDKQAGTIKWAAHARAHGSVSPFMVAIGAAMLRGFPFPRL